MTRAIDKVGPKGLRLDGFTPEELGSLMGLRQWDGWKVLVKALDMEAARVRAGMYDRQLDDTPVTLGRLIGQMEVLERVLGTPGRAAHELQRREKTDERKTASRPTKP